MFSGDKPKYLLEYLTVTFIVTDDPFALTCDSLGCDVADITTCWRFTCAVLAKSNRHAAANSLINPLNNAIVSITTSTCCSTKPHNCKIWGRREAQLAKSLAVAWLFEGSTSPSWTCMAAVGACAVPLTWRCLNQPKVVASHERRLRQKPLLYI